MGAGGPADFNAVVVHEVGNVLRIGIDAFHAVDDVHFMAKDAGVFVESGLNDDGLSGRLDGGALGVLGVRLVVEHDAGESDHAPGALGKGHIEVAVDPGGNIIVVIVVEDDPHRGIRELDPKCFVNAFKTDFVSGYWYERPED